MELMTWDSVLRFWFDLILSDLISYDMAFVLHNNGTLSLVTALDGWERDERVTGGRGSIYLIHQALWCNM